MIRRLAPLALLMLAACHRPQADSIAPDAAADAQAKTQAKALADIAAAEEAAQTPVPARAEVAVPKTTKRPADDRPDEAVVEEPAENGAAAQ